MPRPIALAVALLLLAPLALASGSSTLEDPEGDERLLVLRLPEPLWAPDCRSAAADIRSLRVDSTDDLLVIALTVTRLADPRVDCDRLSLVSPAGHHEGVLREPIAEEVSVDFVHEVSFRAGYGPQGRTQCMSLGFPDGAVTFECLGSLSVSGDTLTWTLPIHGRATVWVPEDPLGIFVHEEERAYDLRGLRMERQAQTRIELVDVYTSTIGTVSDRVAGDAITL